MKLTLSVSGLLFLLFSGCGRRYEVTALYSQQIENSDKTIVEYHVRSTLNDGSKYGTTILRKDETMKTSDFTNFGIYKKRN